MHKTTFSALLLMAATISACKEHREECATTAIRMLPLLANEAQTVEVAGVTQLVRRCQNSSLGSGDALIFRCAHDASSAASLHRCMQVLHVASSELARVLQHPDPERPALTEERDRASEPERNLAKMKTNAKAAFNTDSAYPAMATELTPAVPCCKQPGHRCAFNDNDWRSPSWQSIEFAPDGDTDFQYAYQGSAKSYTALAIGDPGCTGKPVKWILRGTVERGDPAFSLTRVAD